MSAPSGPIIEKESSAEAIKRASAGLRGDIAAELAAPGNHFEEHDKLLLKFHGIYQQDDRDSRPQARATEGGKSYSFMVRVAIPGGALDAEQYLELDRLAGQFANGSLRLTTRQGVQFHGVLKGDLKPALSLIDRSLLTTLAACGDVRRNVMACPAPLADPAHRAVQELSRAIARDLEPRSRAYHQIWLDGERLPAAAAADAPGESVEPFYGTQYLPRKFKIAVALDRDNCVDVYASDCGLIGVSEGGHVIGYNLIAGGGLGLTHNKPDTFARLATVLGSVTPAQAVEAVRAVAAIFRDHGNRADRRHARLKYLIEEWGVAKFRAELLVRLGWRLREPLPVGEPDQHDHLGTHEQGDGRVFLGIHVESGRIADRGERLLRTGLRSVIARFRPGVRVTPTQSLLLTDLEPLQIAGIRAELAAHGVADVVETDKLSAVRRFAVACPALPTCGLALTDAERALPAVVAELERELGQLGVADVPLTVRITGCPNGCARPYNADIGIVGRKPGVYHVLVGGGLSGDRLADLFAPDVPVERIAEVLRPLFTRFAAERRPAEGLSDFYQRSLGRAEERHLFSGRETPTAPRFSVTS